MNKQEIDLGQMDISVKILGTIIVFQKKKKKKKDINFTIYTLQIIIFCLL